MSRKLLPQEFYKEISQKTGCDFEKTKFIWENTIEFLIDELRMYGSIYCPLLGEFKSVTKGGKNVHIPNSKQDKLRLDTEDGFRVEYVDFYQQAAFVPADSLKKALNYQTETTSVWKRAREKARKYEKDLEAFENEKIVLERKQNAMNMVREKKLEDIRKKKEFEKLSKSKQTKFIKEELRNKDWEE